MKKSINIIIIFLGMLLLTSCSPDSLDPIDPHYYNTLSFPDSSATHPKAGLYQSQIDAFVEGGGVGVSIMIRDESGVWLGAGGYADLATGILMQPGNQFLIASTSKLITATAVFTLIDGGILSMEDSVGEWLDLDLIKDIDNAEECQIKHLLGHTGGIRDIYNIKHLMSYMNKKDHQWVDEDMLKFIHGDQAYFEVDEGWYYSNINYILLGMIMEEATGLSLKEIYQQKIFDPLQLESAYYDTGENAIAPGLIHGYTDVNSNSIFVEAKEFYEDDIGLGGDGGIAINAQDLGRFMDELMAGNIISQQSMNEMQNWFEGGYASDGMAGYGLYFEEGTYGTSYGHDGGIIGFESFLSYYPNSDITLAILINNDLILSTEAYDDNFNRLLRELKSVIFE